MSNSDWFRTLGQNAAVVTPSDTGKLEQPSWLYIGGAGNANVITVGGQTVLFSGLVAGTTLPVQVVQVKSTSTTATLMVAVW